ncbi:unnamed protein product [Mesocestoides corti]|uniref:Utp21 domain-containing protein n=2 Tax=Mesocestoides corti TaxID=53468 RepID=A0A158QVA8_MESCO|nr:unnamed protein product [Mesocestoides corti]
MYSPSSIFQPFRALGLASTNVPFVVKYKPHAKEYNILVPIGERFNVYQLPNLKLVGISDCLPGDIAAITSDKHFVYGAVENTIYAFRGLRHVAFKLEGHSSPISHLLAFGDDYLASYDESSLFIVWNLKTKGKCFGKAFPEDTFCISAICHPSGYGDKLLLGSSQGPLQLWKTSSQKPIYWFKGFGSSVTCIVQTPAVDVCAIGLGNGQVVLHNLRYDMSLVSVAQDGGAITSIEFRSDSSGITTSDVLKSAGIESLVEPTANIYLLTGSESGHLSMWQLENSEESGGTCRAVNQVEEFHLARITSMFCIPSGDAAGALVTNGADNCVKVSYFDRPDGGPRTGHIRSGHQLPPTKIAFWTGGSAGGNLLVSSGPDSQLRIFSTYNERYDKNLGRAYAPGMPSAKKLKVVDRIPWLLPGASALAVSPGRAHDWDSLAVVHSNRREVTTWNFIKATRGKHWLDPKKFHGRGGEALRIHKKTIATCLCMTRCGNFVVIGYSSGDIIKFNIQSGLEYGAFGDETAHNSAVVGVHVTNVNRLLTSVGEAEVKFWNFASRELISEALTLPSPPRLSRFHEDGDMLAIALSIGEIILINVLTRRIFRRFSNPPTHPCTDLTLSSDGTLMVTAHRGDPLIKSWDVVDCRLVDCFRVVHPVTSLALSPSDDVLATTHASCLGVYLWSNKAVYQKLHLKPLPSEYAPPLEPSSTASLPTESLTAPRQFDDAEDIYTGAGEEAAPANYVSPDQLQDGLMTLSGLPASYFSAFLQLDAIKKRNAEAIRVVDEAPVELPFFLPAIESTTGMVWLDEDDDLGTATKTEPKKRKRAGGKQVSLDEILLGGGSNILTSVIGDGNSLDLLNDDTCDEVMSRYRSLNPSALDAEIRLLVLPRDELVDALDAVDDNNVAVIAVNPYARLSAFLTLLLNRFRRNLDVDFATACLESVLRYHGDVIVRPPKAPAAAATTVESDFGGDDLGMFVAKATMGGYSNVDATRPLALVEAVLAAKGVAHETLFSQITRSIALIDFIRNATNTLQM